MKYLLDTNICVYWLNGRREIIDKVLELNDDDLAISIITLAELKYGAYNSTYVQKNLQKIEEFQSSIDITELCEYCVDEYARLKSKLKTEGKILDDFDILIAASALVNNYVLVTNNIKHFERIPNLKLENWV